MNIWKERKKEKKSVEPARRTKNVRDLCRDINN
jgi:hypothetical protein